MKILMLATEYPPAKGYGLSRYTFELAAGIANLGVEVHVLTLNFLEGKPDYEQNKVRVHLMTERLGFSSFDWISDAVLDNVRLLERAIEIVERHSCDLIASHDWLAALAAKALKTIYNTPIVHTVHDTEVGKRGNHLSREQLYIAETEAWICEHADKVITTSASMQTEIAGIYKLQRGKIEVIPGGINPSM